jgi:hypothetical protein
MEKVATVHPPLKIGETDLQIDRPDLEIHVDAYGHRRASSTGAHVMIIFF